MSLRALEHLLLLTIGMAAVLPARTVYHDLTTDDFVARCPCGQGWAVTGCLDSSSIPETTTMMLEGRQTPVTGRRSSGGTVVECALGEGSVCPLG